jgi:hypothetical protein
MIYSSVRIFYFYFRVLWRRLVLDPPFFNAFNISRILEIGIFASSNAFRVLKPSLLAVSSVRNLLEGIEFTVSGRVAAFAAVAFGFGKNFLTGTVVVAAGGDASHI